MNKSHKITITAICAAMATIMLVISVGVQLMTIAFFFGAALVALTPMLMFKDLHWYSVGAFVVSAVLTFFMVGSIITIAAYCVLVFPYLWFKLMLDDNQSISSATRLTVKYAVFNSGAAALAFVNLIILGSEVFSNLVVVCVFVGVVVVINLTLPVVDRALSQLVAQYKKILRQVK